MRKLFTLLVFIGLILPMSANAEQKKTLGSWDVHYITVSTTFLTPEIAKAYGIVRSKNTALVNISVLDKRSKKAQDVTISGHARDLLGSQKQLEFKKVEEGEAIYYLATLSFDDQERYRFTIKMNQGNNHQTLKFEQKLYKD